MRANSEKAKAAMRHATFSTPSAFDPQRRRSVVMVVSVSACAVLLLGWAREGYIAAGGSDNDMISPVIAGLSLYDVPLSLTNWFQTATLAVAALLALDVSSRTFGVQARQWRFFSAMLLLMSIDETANIHGWWHRPVVQLLGTENPIITMTPLIAAALAASIYFAPLFRRVGKPQGSQFLIAGSLFLLGAIGFEIASQFTVVGQAMGSALYRTLAGLEESLEIVGGACMVRALAIYGSRGCFFPMDPETLDFPLPAEAPFHAYTSRISAALDDTPPQLETGLKLPAKISLM